MTEKNRTYITHLKVTDVPWHRLTTAYGRGTDFPAHLTVLEQIAPFFLIPHHPYALSLLLKINNGFRTEVFRRLGLTGSSGDWERLVRGVIQEFEENNSGVDLFHFDSDEDVFCVYSQYIDDLMLLSKMIRAACDNEKTMQTYLGKGEVEHEK